MNGGDSRPRYNRRMTKSIGQSDPSRRDVGSSRAPSADFDPDCRACPRLADFLAESRVRYPDYYCRPVPAFGSGMPTLLVVGLAPGLHGANASGRPFTGDHAGILLYQTLYDIGRASRATSESVSDGLELIDCRITNAVKCVPPANKPTPAEIRTCNGWLKVELSSLGLDRAAGSNPDAPRAGRNPQNIPSGPLANDNPQKNHSEPLAVVALGRIAHEAVLRALGLKLADYRFAHGAEHALGEGLRSARLFDSYHCSRYNTQTRRLTPEMFLEVFARADAFARGEDDVTPVEAR